MMLRKLSIGIGLAASILLVVAGCIGCSGGKDDAADSSGGVKFLTLGTAPPGGSFYNIGSAIASVLNEAPDVPWQKASAESTGGSQENLRQLDAEQIEMGMSNSSITYFAVRGEEGFGKKYNVQTLMTMHPLVAMFVTRKGSGIESIADLKGERVYVGPEGAGFEYFVRPILEAHGLTYQDFEPVYGPMNAASGYLQDESVAAAFLGGGLKSPAITSAASSVDIALVPFDAGKREMLIEKYPFYSGVKVPAGTYRGQEQDFAGLNVGSAHLLVRSDADDDLVYQLTKAIWEGRQTIAETHAAGKAINEQNVVLYTGTEFHPGAKRFYEEIGIGKEPAENDSAENDSALEDATAPGGAAGE